MPLNLTTDFQSFSHFKAAINTANTSGRPYNKTDIYRLWNLITALQRLTPGYTYTINANYLLPLMSVGSVASLSSTLSRMRPMLSHFQTLPRITSYNGRIRFDNFQFVSNIIQLGFASYRTRINGNPPISSAQMISVVNSIQNGAPSPISVANVQVTATQAPRAASENTMNAARGRGTMLPMPRIIEDYNLDTEGDNIIYYTREIAGQERNIQTYNERIQRYTADAERFRTGLTHLGTLETMPYNQLRTTLGTREYRMTDFGYNEGANCNCFDCRLQYLRTKISRYEQEIAMANREISVAQRRIETYRRDMPRFEPMQVPESFSTSLEQFISGPIISMLAEAV